MRLLPFLLICLLVIIVSVEGKKGKGKVSKWKPKPNAKPAKGKGSSSAGKKKPAKGKWKPKPAKGKGKKPSEGKPSVVEKPAGGKKPSNGKWKPKPKPAKGKGKPKPKPAKGKWKPKPKPSKGKSKPKPTAKPKPTPTPKPSEAQIELDATYEEAKDLLKRLNDLEEKLELADKQINASRAQSRHIIEDAKDNFAVVDATLSGYQTKCANQVITGWTTSGVNTFYKVGSATAETTLPFTTSTGTFLVPTGAAAAWYNICAFARFRNTGNSNDVVIRKSGSIIAAFGNADQTDWRSTGTCVIEKLSAGNTITVQQESGGSSDCIEETGWYYARLMINTLATENA